MTSEPMVRDLRDLLDERAAVVRDPNAGFEVLAARVVESPQQHHRWLPMLLPPDTKQGVLSMFTATRVVAAMLVLALISTGILAGWALLPAPMELAPAVTSQSPSPSAEASVQPTAEPTPEAEASVANESAVDPTFAATKVLYEFEEGADPFSLAEGHAKTLLYVDRATGIAYEVERDGYRRVLVAPGKESRDGEVFEAAGSVARGGWFTDIIEPDGAYWQWHELYERPPHPMYAWRGARDGIRISTVAPAIPAASFTVSKWVYDMYVIDADSGDIVLYRHKGEDDFGEQRRIERDDAPAVRALYADPVLYVLTDDGVERWVDFTLDKDFELQRPDGPTPDYRAMHGISKDGRGQLWLFDAASDRFHVYDKRSGRFLGSWAAGSDAPSTKGTTGLVLSGDGTGQVGTIAWITPEGLMVSAPTQARLVTSASASAVNSGSLRPSDRGEGERALDFSEGRVQLLADRLRLKVGDKVWKATGKVKVGLDASNDLADLELEWKEGGVDQRLFFHMVSEGDHWWIRDVWSYDGHREGDWVYYEDLAPLTRTRVGESLTGDLVIESTNASRPRFQEDGSATLRIEGMKLTAFDPMQQPAPLTGCKPPESDVWVDSDPMFRGHSDSPLASLIDLTPAEIEAELQELGLCYRFTYNWANGFEHRCNAPPGGKVEKIITIEDHIANDPRLMVRVDVFDKTDKTGRNPPPYGLGCEPLVPS